MNNSNYKGKNAIVTGGGDGLGREICIALAKYGATVICTDKDFNLAKNTTTFIKSQIKESDSIAFQMDVTDEQQVSEVIDSINSNYGKIDYFFNNAGITIGGEIRDLKIRHWKKVIDVNLLGIINCSSKVFKIMSAYKQGHIINITSISGLLEYTALSTPYAVSKHGAVTFSKALALEAMDFNVKVTTVCPGAIKTNIADKMEHINSNENAKKRAIEFIDKGISPDLAAEKVLKDVLKNKEIIIFPTAFKNYYFATKIFRFLEKSMALKLIREFRKNDRLE
ncbi:short-chain dehydrogenase [Prolixibacter bellariivorans]|uniref:Short-chain dehydrogenase n=1 Tax=Prolixibacter bellariivorans TaxID=314319 RepID=A0A5M4B0M6_9BACT|nr:SDR family oxidoreductase [Prolixibacter bellariivorans]GET33719.1 short-chain dehydrogenase [Prolixibacter bellariivorans]